MQDTQETLAPLSVVKKVLDDSIASGRLKDLSSAKAVADAVEDLEFQLAQYDKRVKELEQANENYRKAAGE